MTEKDNICARMSELFFDYIERRNEVEDGEFSELERHLETCEACRRELVECEKMISAVKAAEEEPPRELRLGVMTAVRAEAKAYRRQRLLRSVSGVAAAVAICVGVVFLFDGMKFDVAFDAPGSGGMKDEFGGNVDADNVAPDYSDENVDDFIENIFGADGDSPNGGAAGEGENDSPVSPEMPEDGDCAPDTERNEVFYYSDTVTDDVKEAFGKLAPDCGGVYVLISGEDAKDALIKTGEYLDADVNDGAILLDYGLLEKAEAALYRALARFDGAGAVGYKLDGGEKRIVIAIK